MGKYPTERNFANIRIGDKVKVISYKGIESSGPVQQLYTGVYNEQRAKVKTGHSEKDFAVGRITARVK